MSTSSYVNIPAKAPLLYASFPDLLDQQAATIPDKEAYVFWARAGDSSNQELTRQSSTFKTMANRSTELASRLLQMGLTAGDRVAIFGWASLEWLYIDLATQRIKVLMVRIPPSLMYSDKLPEFLQKHRCKVIFLDVQSSSRVFEHVRKVLPGAIARSVTTTEITLKDECTEWPQLVISTRKTTSCPGLFALSDLFEKAGNCDVDAVARIQSTIDPDEAALIFPTSGSCGVPKLVAHSMFSIVNSYGGQSAEMVYCTDRPFTWVGSISLLPLVAGCTYVHVENQALSGVAELCKILTDEKVNMVTLSVSNVHEILSGLESGSLQKPPTLMVINTAGEKLPNSVRKRVLSFFPVQLVVYGSTETNPASVDMAMAHTFRVDPSSDGDQFVTLTIKDGYEVKITDDMGRCVPRGTSGHVQIRSRMGFSCYLDDPDMTAAAVSPRGWVSPGDVASITPDNRLQLEGRTADFIKKGPTKIHASVVENVIKRHEGVALVHVTGVDDQRLGEEIGAGVVPRAGSDVTPRDIRRFCEENIALDLVPKYIKIMAELPSLAAGKVDRLALKTILASCSD